VERAIKAFKNLDESISEDKDKVKEILKDMVTCVVRENAVKFSKSGVAEKLKSECGPLALMLE
jgi:hypothetical protein